MADLKVHASGCDSHTYAYNLVELYSYSFKLSHTLVTASMYTPACYIITWSQGVIFVVNHHPLSLSKQMVSLYRDPLGEDIFADHLQTVNVSRDGTIIIMDKDDKLLELQARVKQLENLLEENKVSSWLHLT